MTYIYIYICIYRRGVVFYARARIQLALLFNVNTKLQVYIVKEKNTSSVCMCVFVGFLPFLTLSFPHSLFHWKILCNTWAGFAWLVSYVFAYALINFDTVAFHYNKIKNNYLLQQQNYQEQLQIK